MKAKLLVVEDSGSQGRRLTATLEKLGYEVVWVRTGMEALRACSRERPNVVLLDVVLDDMDGYSVCRWLKLQEETRDIPVIMTTIRGEVDDKVEGLHVGADDYLAKPIDARELEARIFAALRAQTARFELKKRNLQLEEMLHHAETLAITDSLTGLFNRRRFSDVARRELAVTRRYKNPLSCVMIDLDHFKKINDVHGHAVGDDVLRRVAHVLGENVREVDVVARYGGEEFVLLLPHTSKENAVVVAERVRGQIKGLELEYDSVKVVLSASFGVADDKDAPSGKWEELVRAADIALYRAKRTGRDRIVLAEAGQLGPDFEE